MRKRATSYDKKGKSVFDDVLFSSLCVISSTENPNFKDAESIKKLGCAAPEQYLNKVLLAGEIENLAREILNASGFGKNINDLIADVKNC